MTPSSRGTPKRSLAATAAKALAGIRVLGFLRSLQVARFTVDRYFLERRYRVRATARPAGPGRAVGGTATEGGARIRFEQAELDVHFVAGDVVRLTWCPGADPLPYAVVDPGWPSPAVAVDEGPQGWSLTTSDLTVEVGRHGRVEYRTPGGRVRVDWPPQRLGEAWIHRARLRPDETVHGLGERAAPLDLRDGTYEMWNSGPGGTYGPGRDPLYLCVPVYLTCHRDGGYLVFHENTHRGRVTMAGGEVAATFSGGALRTWVVIGDPAHALDRYTALTGRPALPPRWALGFHQARWGYRRQEDVHDVLAGYRDHGLPLAAVHLDIDCMDDYRVFTFSPERFSDMPGLVESLDGAGVRLVVIVDPGVQRNPDFALYQEGLAGERFCQLPSGKTAHGVVWPGWAAFPDFTDPGTRSWWGEQYRVLTDAGVAGIWHDMNEPVAFALVGESAPPVVMRHSCEGRGGDHAETRNVYALAMAQAAHDGLRALTPDRRPFIISRAGWAGIQRYAWTWTGDTESTWAMLRQTVPQVLGLGLSGIPFAGPDVGGFRGKPTAELYLRWFQLATFLPFFRAHSAFDSTPREPWLAAGDRLDVVRRFLDLRGRLLPYLYTLAWEAHRRGAPMVRPLWWPDGDDARRRGAEDAFFLGDALLVAPVLIAGERARQVPLPPGRWYPLGYGDPIEGGRDVVVDAPLDTVPVFVRGGSVLPLEAGDGHLELHLHVPADGGHGHSTLYRDAGDGDGPWRYERFAVHRSGPRVRVEAESERAGTLGIDEDGISVHVWGGRPAAARVDGRAVPVAGPVVQVGSFAVLEIDLEGPGEPA